MTSLIEDDVDECYYLYYKTSYNIYILMMMIIIMMMRNIKVIEVTITSFQQIS